MLSYMLRMTLTIFPLIPLFCSFFSRGLLYLRHALCWIYFTDQTVLLTKVQAELNFLSFPSMLSKYSAGMLRYTHTFGKKGHPKLNILYDSNPQSRCFILIRMATQYDVHLVSLYTSGQSATDMYVLQLNSELRKSMN